MNELLKMTIKNNVILISDRVKFKYIWESIPEFYRYIGFAKKNLSRRQIKLGDNYINLIPTFGSETMLRGYNFKTIFITDDTKTFKEIRTTLINPSYYIEEL